MLPVGVPLAAVTVALKVRAAPEAAGLGVMVSVVVEAALAMVTVAVPEPVAKSVEPA